LIYSAHRLLTSSNGFTSQINSNMTKTILQASAWVVLAFLPYGCQQNSPPKPMENTSEASGETLPWATNLDLVCEMKIKQTVEDTVHYNGKIYGFCNPGCKEKFLENPVKYGAN
jgi:YHS domain-containing protein